jgi:3-hydroxyacyl-CoA dehydrogenase
VAPRRRPAGGGGTHEVGIVGAGKMGGTLAELWAKAGLK